MKRYLSFVAVFLILCFVAYNPGILPSAENADQIKVSDNNEKTLAIKEGYLENVLFGKFSGKERINLIVSQQPVINVSTSTKGSLVVKLENMIVPDSLQGTLGEGELSNIISVQPRQQVLEGKKFVYLTIGLKKTVPYAIRQEGKNIFLDFNTATLRKKAPVASPIAKGKKKKKIVIVNKEDEAKTVDEAAASIDDVTQAESDNVKKVTSKFNSQRIISLDFQDADIKTVLRLMAEYGDTSIISGADVNGKVTMTIKNTPWEQALDSILDTQGLAKKKMGDVITVMTLERKKKDEADRAAAESAQVVAEETRQERELKKMAEKGKLRQVLIEAKIVEAQDTFVRNLGIQWGFNNQQRLGNNGYGLGAAGGTNPSSSNLNRQEFTYPAQIPWVKAGTTDPVTMAAVNFAAAAAGPTLGLVFGNALGFIETQLSAMEKNGSGKVISSPKVVTMDGVKAVIKQGSEIPYESMTKDGPKIEWKQAVLELNVKPQITEEGKISMEITAKNDRPDYTYSTSMPSIIKNEVESKIVVQDGDTLVIGGVSKSNEDETTTGIPWFYKIPVLGWLFKTEGITKSKLQLLIFITPKIVGGADTQLETKK